MQQQQQIPGTDLFGQLHQLSPEARAIMSACLGALLAAINAPGLIAGQRSNKPMQAPEVTSLNGELPTKRKIGRPRKVKQPQHASL